MEDQTTTDRLAEIRAKHKHAIDHDGDENGFDSTIEFCAYCENDEWPCEPAFLADQIEKLQGQLGAVLAVRPLPTRPNATRITLAGAKGHALALADVRRALGWTPEQIADDFGSAVSR